MPLTEEDPRKEEADPQDEFTASAAEDGTADGDFDEPRDAFDEDDGWNTTEESPLSRSNAVSSTKSQDSEDRAERFQAANTSVPRSKTVLYRFLTNRKIDGDYIIDDDERQS